MTRASPAGTATAPREGQGAVAFACSRCGEAFARAAHLALHRGRAHAEPLTGDERAAFEAAVAEEEAWLAALRRHVKAGMNVLPLLVLYLFILLLVGLSGIPLAWGLLLLPGLVAFGALLYYMSYSKA